MVHRHLKENIFAGVEKVLYKTHSNFLSRWVVFPSALFYVISLGLPFTKKIFNMSF